MIRTVPIYRDDGTRVDVPPSTVRVWLAQGFSESPPGDSATPETLHAPVVSTQASDVTAPGESKIEGDEPEPDAQDEE